MDILHKLSKDDIEAVTNTKIAHLIVQARTNELIVQSGGGGVYGKVTTKD